ncbi:alpha-L-fucosidase [Microbacterium resistens]|uniref:alpha-L-fucosidase n=2 Tax=Microbacterium resistens TaxID=156977 RepID=A0ABU1SAK6_9MICO|nr:alpha-L-fucosidase [Microbacterium resistens]
MQDRTTRPRPTPAQLRWQRAGLGMFVHFGVNTFAGREWSDGSLPPSIFDPSALDAEQWARAAVSLGAASVVLTAKHHDGFCLWPTRTTDYSVASSPWRGGAGDVVGELAKACAAHGLGLGLYLSPWDRHAPEYDDPERYDDLYAAQLTELMTGYGDLVEVWFDGAGSEGRVYDWPRYMEIVRRHQPDAMIFNMGEPTIRWIGNEDGLAADPVDYTADSVPLSQYVTGAASLPTRIYLPPECDVSIRRGWFWHEDEEPKGLDHLLAIHLASIGLGANLLLNVPPSRSGLIDERDLRRIGEFRRELDARFGAPVATRLTPRGPGVWDAVLPWPVEAGHLELREALEQGQRATAHEVRNGVEGDMDGEGALLARGGSIGVRRIHPLSESSGPSAGPVLLSALTVRTDRDVELAEVLVHPATASPIVPRLPEGYQASTEAPE